MIDSKYFGHVARTADGNIRVELPMGCFIKRSGDRMKYLVAAPGELDSLYELLRNSAIEPTPEPEPEPPTARLDFPPGLYEWDPATRTWKPAPAVEPLVSPLPGENLAATLDAAENSIRRADQLLGHAMAMETRGNKAWAERLRKAADELDKRARYTVMEALGVETPGVEATSDFDDEEPDKPRHAMRGVAFEHAARYSKRITTGWKKGVYTIRLDNVDVGQARQTAAGWIVARNEQGYGKCGRRLHEYGQHATFGQLLAAIEQVGHVEYTPPSVPIAAEPEPDLPDSAPATFPGVTRWETVGSGMVLRSEPGGRHMGHVDPTRGGWAAYTADGEHVGVREHVRDAQRLVEEAMRGHIKPTTNEEK